VYGIVKQSGGNVWVYSEPGRGATFKVYLPGVDEPVEGPAAVAPPTRPRKGTETVLVVEDNESVRRLVHSVLQGHGYTVLDAAEPAEALALVERYGGHIALLVTDVVMPGISGRELARQLEAARPGLLVLYMSGYTDDAIVNHGVLEVGVAFLQKPFTPAGLLHKVREVLDRAGA
jgi:CheY-like chemotaxis protein